MPGSTLQDLQAFLTAAGPAQLGPGTRPAALAESALERTLDDIFDKGEIASARQPLVRALVLLWHDHLESAHVIAQAIDNADGSFIHAIMHRREPDYGNSKYWFHRVGAHPAFPAVAAQAGLLLKPESDFGLRANLLAQGRSDPFAFVDACEAAARGDRGSPFEHLLRQIQKIESEVLLARLAG